MLDKVTITGADDNSDIEYKRSIRMALHPWWSWRRYA